MENSSKHALFSIGSVPISEAQPCGVNIRYDSAFDSLEAELAKQESLSAETVNWDVVATLSAQIIQGSSKDLLVGSYLCYALLIKDGYQGLSVGLTILNDMVSIHWEGLFPPAKRMRARQTAITWLSEKAGAYVLTLIPGSNESESVIEAAGMLKQLDGTLVEKMGDQAPMLSDLSRPLKGYRQSALAELESVQQAPEPVAGAIAEASATEPAVQLSNLVAESARESEASPLAATDQTLNVANAPQSAAKQKSKTAPPPDVGLLESDADSKKILRQLQSTARDVAGFWISQKLSDARPYRIARMAVFMTIERAPPDNSGVTQVNPPTPERLKFFEAQSVKGESISLIPELEKTLARSPYWFDGQFMVVKSLRSSGAEYEEAVQAVIRELGNFISRLPEVVNLSFSNKLPFANDQTRMWLEAEVLGQGSGGSSNNVDEDESNSGELWARTLLDAKKLAAAGDIDKALVMLSEGMSSAGQLREQVYWRCAIADLMLHTGKSDVAVSLLEQASLQVKTMRIPEWEPQLLAKIYTLLFQSYQKQQKANKDDKSLKGKTELAYEQLCWFDPIAALSLEGG